MLVVVIFSFHVLAGPPKKKSTARKPLIYTDFWLLHNRFDHEVKALHKCNLDAVIINKSTLFCTGKKKKRLFISV